MSNSMMGGGFMSPMERQAAKRDAALQADFAAIDDLRLGQEEKNDLKFSKAQQAFGPSFNRGDFNFLLDRLTGSKIRQNRDAQAQERQNIYARGLSSMFANF
jgi:hypothetical protein